MSTKRPDISQVAPEIQAYIEYLESELERLNAESEAGTADNQRNANPEPSEPPTTINLITASPSGLIKRTPRHLYGRQRRGGMGIFDLDLPEDDAPGLLTLADEGDTLLMLTNQARVLHLPVTQLSESPIRAKGQPIRTWVPLDQEDTLAFIGPMRQDGYLAMLSERGYVRVLRYNYVGPAVRPGSQVFDTARFGEVIAAAWVRSEDDLFIATAQGLGIRFSAKRVHPAGSLGIRLEKDDMPIAIAGVTDESSIFLLSQDGKGTIRLMSGFRENKTLGSGGKVALKTERLAAALSIAGNEDLFIISKLSKLIRFQAEEIPVKEGVVQGVNCMNLRADICMAAAVSPLQAA